MSPSSLTFDPQKKGTTSSTKTVTITNEGLATSSITFTVPADFSIVNNGCAGATLNALSPTTCTVTMAYAPTAFADSKTGTLSMTSSSNSTARTVTLSGSSPAPSMTVTPSSLTLPNTKVGNTSGVQTATVTNTSTLNDLTLDPTSALSLNQAAQSAGFAKANSSTCANNTVLAAGGSANCKVDITLTPTSTGALSGTLTVTANGSPAQASVSLSGTGYNNLAVAPLSLSFSDQTAGTTSASKTVTLTNNSGGAITLNSFTFGGTNPADYSQTNNCGSSLANGSSCTVNVVFKPQAVRSSSAVLIIASSDPNTPAQVALSGNGVVGVPVLSLSANQIDFGVQVVSTTSAVQSVTVTNTGAVVMSNIGITIGGTNSGDFAKAGSSTCASSLQPSASCRVDVTFTPATGGADYRQASLTVSSNATTAQNTVSLVGTRVAATATTTVNGQTINLSTSCGTLPNFAVSATPTGAFTGTYDKPYGFFSFRANVSGCTSPVTFIYSLPGTSAVSTYLKCASATASSCAPLAGTSVTADGKRVTFQLSDNGQNGDVTAGDNFIDDPGAPAAPPAPVAAAASSSSGAFGWGALLVLAVPAVLRRRRRH